MSDTPQQQFHEILSEFDSAMLVTRAPDGQLRSRPMALAKVAADNDLWFVTDSASAKVDEIDMNPQVNVSMQSGSRYASISGRAKVVNDRAKIKSLWSEAWKVWFPDGPDDPRIVLLHVDADTGEFWDNAGLNKLKYLFQAGKAYLEGTTPDPGDDQHQKVDL